MERENILQARDLCYTYDGDHRALNGVSMDIAAGERIAVMGSNGAGKSTFFLHLNGVLRADSGAVLCRGREVTDRAVHELRRRVGIVFQNADDQIIASTVGQEVAFGPMNLKLPKEEVLSRTEEALACLNLSAYRDRPPHYLSGGEKKRVSIADIIAMHPEIIIFDEPTASLDPQGKTILLSTHDVDFAYRWAERVVVFHGGEIIADGGTLPVFQDREVLLRAGLRRPMLLDLYEGLRRRGIAGGKDYPRSVEELLDSCGG